MPSLKLYLQMACNAFAANTLEDRKPPWVKKHKFNGVKAHPKNHQSLAEIRKLWLLSKA
jgi:hypothetical protein